MMKVQRSLRVFVWRKRRINTYRMCFLKQGGEAFFYKSVCDRDGDLGTSFFYYSGIVIVTERGNMYVGFFGRSFFLGVCFLESTSVEGK